MSIVELILPRTSDAMTEAILASWLVADQSEVVAGDIVAEVETEKAMVEVTVESDGFLVAAVPVSATVEVGGVLAFVLSGQDIEDYRSGTLVLGTTVTEPPQPIQISPKTEPEAGVIDQQEVFATPQELVGIYRASDRALVSSPLARKLAKDAGLDLATLAPGSGPGGRIVRADIEAALSNPSGKQVAPLTPRQRAMAAAMVQSTTIPHFSISRDIPLGELIQLRLQLKRSNLEPPSLSAFFVRILAIAMRDNPLSRVSWVADGIKSHSTSAIGVAVADGDTDLVVPVIHNAESKSLWDIGKEIQGLSLDVKDRRLRPEQLQGALATISNLGMFGIDTLTPIIPPGQCFIIGIGRSRERLAYDSEGRVIEETYVSVTLSGDHRILTGLGAARLLDRFSDVCENPIQLFDPEVFQI